MNRTMGKRVPGSGMGRTMWAVLSLMCALCTLCTCSLSTHSTDGGGSRGGNPVVAGTIIGTDGAQARNVRVALIAENYNPVSDAQLQFSSIDTTDSLGSFTITAPDSGRYNIEAAKINGVARLIRFHVEALRDSVVIVPVDTLHRPGEIKVSSPEGSNVTEGYVYVPGTRIAAWFSRAADTLMLDSVPVGVLPVLYYVKSDGSAPSVIRYDIPVQSDATTLIDNPQWSHCRRIILNTSPNGAGVADDVCGFPVLIRLTGADFDFTQALPGGADLMFTGSGNQPLPCEIERWDATGNRAEIWVKIDTVFGNDSGQSITMYWGASTPEFNSPAVFDTAAGFQGVWHLGDADGDSIRDATINRYHGISPDGARPVLSEGMIGGCRKFDGVDDYITMQNTAGGRLSFPQDGSYTVCAWVKIDTFLYGAPQLIVSKGYEQYFLRSTYFPSNSPMWEFVEFNETANWQSSRSPATSRQWISLVGVRQGSSQFLYCNGMLVDSTRDSWPQGISRNTANDLSIGGFLKGVTVPANDGYCFFYGTIDEVRILSAAQSPGWVRLCFMNQRPDDRLVMFK